MDYWVIDKSCHTMPGKRIFIFLGFFLEKKNENIHWLIDIQVFWNPSLAWHVCNHGVWVQMCRQWHGNDVHRNAITTVTYFEVDDMWTFQSDSHSRTSKIDFHGVSVHIFKKFFSFINNA